MTRLTHTTAITLALGVPALTGAHAFNTTPYVYGQPNTTINSSVKPAVASPIYSQPNTTINSSIKPFVMPNTIYSQPNVTINSSVKPFVVPNTTYSQPNTTINSSVKPFVVPNSIYGTTASPTTVQSMAAQAAAGKTATQVTVASQAMIAQNAPFVPKGAPTLPSQLSSYGGLNAGSSADLASGPAALQNAAAAQMQSLTEVNAINAQMQAQQMTSAADRQNILVNTQTSIFQIQQDIAQNLARTAYKEADKLDQYLGN
jgi:hypothetical protein